MVIIQRYRAGHRGAGGAIYVDGLKVATLYGGEKATLHIPAGPHTISIGDAGWPLETIVREGQCVVYSYPGDPMVTKSGC